MIEEQGRIVAANAEEAWVQTIQQSACQSCSAQKGCGQKALSSMSSGRAMQVKVVNTLNVQIGDEVVVGIPESALLRASLVLYLVPLLAMIVGALLTRGLVSPTEGWVTLGGLLGLAVGLGLARVYSVRHQADTQFSPQLLRRAGLGCSTFSDSKGSDTVAGA